MLLGRSCQGEGVLEGHNRENQHDKGQEEDDGGEAALAPEAVLSRTGKVAAGVGDDQDSAGTSG